CSHVSSPPRIFSTSVFMSSPSSPEAACSSSASRSSSVSRGRAFIASTVSLRSTRLVDSSSRASLMAARISSWLRGSLMSWGGSFMSGSCGYDGHLGRLLADRRRADRGRGARHAARRTGRGRCGGRGHRRLVAVEEVLHGLDEGRHLLEDADQLHDRL